MILHIVIVFPNRTSKIDNGGPFERHLSNIICLLCTMVMYQLSLDYWNLKKKSERLVVEKCRYQNIGKKHWADTKTTAFDLHWADTKSIAFD